MWRELYQSPANCQEEMHACISQHEEMLEAWVFIGNLNLKCWQHIQKKFFFKTDPLWAK